MSFKNQDFNTSALLMTRFSNLGLSGTAFIARTLRPVLEIAYAGQPNKIVTVGLEADGETGKTRFCESLLGVGIKEGPLKDGRTDIDWTIGWNNDIRARISSIDELGTVVWMDALGLAIEKESRDPMLHRSNFAKKYDIADEGGMTLIEHYNSCDPSPVIDCHIALKKDWDDFYFQGTAKRTLEITVGDDVYESEPYQTFLQRAKCLNPQLIN